MIAWRDLVKSPPFPLVGTFDLIVFELRGPIIKQYRSIFTPSILH